MTPPPDQTTRRLERPPLGRDEPTLHLSPSDSTPGFCLPQGGPYQMVKEIGRGGMGAVFLARDEKLGRYVAIKRLTASVVAHSALKARFFREARAIASLNHRHIVHLYDLDEDERGPLIVMEYVAGPSQQTETDVSSPAPSLNLEQHVAELGRPLAPGVAVDLVCKLCRAMEYAHRHGVIHRDLKPSNILLDETFEPKIVDFGLARKLEPGEARLTVSGAKLLSLGYGAPEQENDTHEADHRADIYALGGILYFALTGENPRFFRENRLPQYLRPVLLKAIEKNREDRWATAADFEQALIHAEESYLSLTTETDMWRCKWCSRLNPLDKRYCDHCGWDGMERCPECGHDSRVGVRFCSACQADIRQYEAAVAWRNRLREFRDQKDFERITKEAEAAPAFRPAGPTGRALQEEILQLQREAASVLSRKAELRETIARAWQEQDYEEAVSALAEYDQLDNTDPFAEWRAEIPWRLAERDVEELERQVAYAERLLAERKLKTVRGLLDELSARRDQLETAAARLPERPHPFGPARHGATGLQRIMVALSSLAVRLDRLRLDWSRASQRLAELTEEVHGLFRSRRYDACLSRGAELVEWRVEADEMENILREASKALQGVAAHLKQAEHALRYNRIDIAARIARTVLRSVYPESAAAQALLAHIRRRRWERGLVTGLTAAMLAFLLYLLSLGPVTVAAQARYEGAIPERVRLLYAPARWLREFTLLRRPLDAYARRWNVPFTVFPVAGQWDRNGLSSSDPVR